MNRIKETVGAIASVVAFGATLAVGFRLGNYVMDGFKNMIQDAKSIFSKKEKES